MFSILYVCAHFAFHLIATSHYINLQLIFDFLVTASSDSLQSFIPSCIFNYVCGLLGTDNSSQIYIYNYMFDDGIIRLDEKGFSEDAIIDKKQILDDGVDTGSIKKAKTYVISCIFLCCLICDVLAVLI